MRILKVIIESGPHNYSAYIDGVSGIGVTGKTIGKIIKNIREAVDFYIEVAKEDGSYIPEPLRGDYDFTFEMDPETLPHHYVMPKGNKVVKVIIEDAGTNFCAYVDGAPIITVGDNIQELKTNIEEAIELYLDDNPTPCEQLRGDYDLVYEMAPAPTVVRKMKATKQKVLQPA